MSPSRMKVDRICSGGAGSYSGVSVHPPSDSREDGSTVVTCYRALPGLGEVFLQSNVVPVTFFYGVRPSAIGSPTLRLSIRRKYGKSAYLQQVCSSSYWSCDSHFRLLTLFFGIISIPIYHLNN